MKKIKYLMLILLTFLSFNNYVYADSISLSKNKNSIVVGNSVTISSTVSSNSPLVSIEGTLSCSGAGTGGGIDLRFDDSSNSVKSKSYSYTVKATKSGTITCKVSGRMTSMDSSSWKNLGEKTVTVKVMSQAELEATYSKNNNLSSLSVEGQTLSPEFNKDNLEYIVELENEIEKINIIAKAEDSKSSINGTGEVAVEEGNNKIEIKVTAQNGNEKVYVINAKVKELDPINVKVENEEYSVVRKSKNLEKPNDFFEESTTKINDLEVPVFVNKKANIVLVGLKDKKGDINYYIYNKTNNSFTKYKELKIGNLIILLKDIALNKIPKNYKEFNLSINKNKIKGYKYKASSSFYLISGINLENGKDNLYVYDKNENTIQRYNDEVINALDIKLDNYMKYTIIIGSVVGILIVIISIVLIVKSKQKKKNFDNKLNNTKEFEV